MADHILVELVIDPALEKAGVHVAQILPIVSNAKPIIPGDSIPIVTLPFDAKREQES